MPERLPYDEAMLASPIRMKIQDPELKEGRVETITVNTAAGQFDLPWGIEGGFAVVYKFRTKSGRLRALRCFRVPMSADTQMRYEHIGPYFHAHTPAITAGFKYHNNGIVVKDQSNPQGQIYPVIEMDWIDGITLLDKVHEYCENRDRAGLRALIEQWLDIVHLLHDTSIAHGDLAGVNVMIRPDDSMVLIDYDGVYIPEFAGMTQLLVGQEDYQHPQMAQRAFDEHMDAFSALVIYIALVVVEAQPELWQKYVKLSPAGKPVDVNMLFRHADFKNPQSSALIQELEQMSNPFICDLVQELKQACLQPVQQVRFPFDLIDPHYRSKIALEKFRLVLSTVPHSASSIINAYDAALLDNSTAITTNEREKLAAARRYQAMYKQVYRGIQEDNDNIIRYAYDPALSQQFTDISAAEQKRIDRAMLFQHLEDLLARKAYGQAINVAHSIRQKTGQELSEDLVFKLRRATMRFIKTYDLIGLAVKIQEQADSNYAIAQWQWPTDELIQHALIVWRADRWPERPADKSWQDPEWKHTWSWRRNNAHDGTCTFPINRNRHIYVRGYLAILDGWEHEQVWRFSEGNDPTSSVEAVSSPIIWRLQQ